MNLIQGRITLLSNGHPLHEISIKSLVGYLETQGVPCRSLYLNSARSLTAQQCQQVLALCEGSTLVGCSLMSKDVKTLRPVTAELRRLGTPVIWGGIHATAMPAESLQHCDYACVGEGELTLFTLYARLCAGNADGAGIPNLAYGVNGQAVLPQTWHSEPSLDALPYPDYEFHDAHMLRGDGQIRPIPPTRESRSKFFGLYGLLFYSQRGCPFSCAYCSNSLYHAIATKTATRWYRTTSPARVKEELRHHLQFVPVRDALSINDDDFITRPLEEIEEICKFIKHELGLRFNINATPAAVTREKMAVLAQYGLRQIAMGVQTGSVRILRDVYQRRVFPEQVLKAANIISEFYKDGVVADYGFILENPYEQPADHRDSITLLLSLPKPFNVSLYSLAFFPGTNLTTRALGENMIRQDEISLDKDYRESLRPSYAHMLFEANYAFAIPAEINAILLSDNLLLSEQKKYVRLLLANYFVSDAVRRLAGVNALGLAAVPPVPNAAERDLVEYLYTLAEIIKKWSEPTQVLRPSGTDEDLILQYAPPAGDRTGAMIEIGFSKGKLVRLGAQPVAATAPANALNDSYRRNRAR